MPRTTRRVIRRRPDGRNYFLVDACFLANKYLKPTWFTNAEEQNQIRLCHAWWKEITQQIDAHHAVVYVPDVCISEAFKVLAKKYYRDRVFRYHANYKAAREALRKDIHLPLEEARKQHRHIRFHDIGTTRDIIISVDRFFEMAHKLKVNVGIVDLILLAAGKYLMDFYGFGRKNLFIITIDTDLYKLARKYQDVPKAFNPLRKSDAAAKVFV